MLYKSGVNLEQGGISFVENNSDVILFSAFLKLDALKRLNVSGNIKQIIVRWGVEDLCKKVSDIELYEYCMKNKIVLYRNTRIHLKAFWNNHNSVFLGSANITNKGIGEKGSFNFELNGIINNITFEDQSYLNKIILDSQYVTEELYEELNRIVNDFDAPVIQYPKFPTPPPTIDYFLINQLPMTSSPELLYNIFQGEKSCDTEMNCASHDLELYNIPTSLNKDEFLAQLKNNFNCHPFISEFKETVKNSKDSKGRNERDGSMRFGAVRNWFAKNTTTVPTPRSYELSDYIVILYNWICYFDNEFYWDVPGSRSEVIYYNK